MITLNRKPKQGHPFYWSPQWRALRKRILARDGYCCTVCHAYVGATGAARIDHIQRIKDNPRRAFDPSNLRTLCTTCDAQGHREKGQGQREPRNAKFNAFDHNGKPLDPNHHWNR